jgi:hypothetical protein
MKFRLGQMSLLSLCLLYCLITICIITAYATSVVVPSDDELVVGARAIVRGTVTAVNSRYDEQHKAIFTYVTLQVRDVLKGDLQPGEVTLKEPGGVVGDQGSMIFGTPSFTPGENVLLYLDTWPDGSLRVYQWFLGKFIIGSSRMNARPMISREVAGINVRITGRSPSGAITDRMELDSYLALIRARVAAKRQESIEHQSRFFEQAPMLAQPPEMTGQSASTPTQNFTFINPTNPPRWFEPDGGQNVVFKINPAGAPNGQIVNDMIAAMNAWSNVGSTALRVANGGTTSNCGLLVTDGENTISFNNCDNYSAFSPSPGQTCSGILAAAGIIRYSLTQTRVINGITFYRALEGNMSFNPFASCYFSNSCNVQEVATHELGHALGLGHSLDTTATMHAYAHFDGRCASLRSDDIAAIRFLYPGTSAPPPTPTPTPTPTPPPSPVTIATTSLPGGQVGAFYSAALSGSGGRTPYSWSAVAGQMAPGVSLSVSGLLSGTPTTAGTFSFTARLTDALGQTAQRTLSINIAGSAPPPPPPPPPPSGQRAARGDFDGDGRTDLGVWRGSTGAWQILKSAGGTQNTAWGSANSPYNDIATPGDFDGDGRIDCAVWRPMDGNWYVLYSSNGQSVVLNLGANGDRPVPADYDGDGITDMAVWRGSTGFWYIRQSSTGGVIQSVQWGSAAAQYRDIPTPGDFDGDGKADVAVWRSTTATWFIINSSNGQYRIVTWGQPNDLPVQADFDGDGRTDLATWRASTGFWYIQRSSNNSTQTAQWGAGYAPYNDIPTPGDFDGDRKADIAVWRPSSGTWFIIHSSNGSQRVQNHGASGDTPVPSK